MPLGPKGCAFAILLTAGLLTGCASPTPYQPADDGEGYTEQSLEDDRYRIAFSGNSVTERETVEDYLLYRAAEVTLQRGYDYFIIVEKDTERSTRYQTMGTGFGGPLLRRGYHGSVFYDPFYNSGFGRFGTSSSVPIDRYKAYANIVMRHGVKPDDETDAYDARTVIDRLDPKIAHPESS